MGGAGSGERSASRERRPEAQTRSAAARMAFLLEGLADPWQVEGVGGWGMVSPGGADPDSSELENRCDSRERGGCLWTHPRGRRQDCGNQGSGGGRDGAGPRIPGRGWDAGEPRWGVAMETEGKDKDREGGGGMEREQL